MTGLHTLKTKPLLGMILALAGLNASIASAQFQVEHTAVVEVETSSDLVDHEESVVIIEISDGEQVVHVRLVNSEVSVVKVDDEVLDEDHYFVRGDELLIKDDDGEVIREIKLPKIQSDDDKVLHATHAWRAEPGDDSERVVERAYGFVTKDSVDDDGFFRQLQGQTYEPKVMLGINLGEPSKVLRKHLKLKDGVHAILVEDVIDGLPADKAGLEDFDVIISIDGSDDADGKLLGEVLSEKEPGDQMKIVVLRSGEKVRLKIKLEAYDAEALGAQQVLVERSSSPMPSQGAFTLKVDSSAKNDSNIEFLIEQFKDGEFGNLQGADLEKLKDELHRAFSESNEQREKAYVIRAKAMDAMKDVERQIVEFRDGKLIIRANADLDRRVEHLKGRVHEAGEKLHHEAIAPHTQELDHRLAELEDRLDEQMARMSDQMDRLADMFERLMDRLEDDED